MRMLTILAALTLATPALAQQSQKLYVVSGNIRFECPNYGDGTVVVFEFGEVPSSVKFYKDSPDQQALCHKIERLP